MNNENFLKNFFMAFLKAWNIFFEMPFPASEKFNKKINYSNTNNDDLVLYAIPFVGLVIGFAAFVVIAIIYFIFVAEVVIQCCFIR